MFTVKKSLTLTEVLVSSAVFLIVVLLISSITGTGRISWMVASAKRFLCSQARQVSLSISREIMISSSSRIFIGNNSTSITLSIPLVNSTSGELELDERGDLLWGDGQTQGNSIRYMRQENNLTRQILDAELEPVTGEGRTIAQNVTNFTVSSASGGYDLETDFYLDSYLNSRLPDPIEYNLTFSVKSRN